MNLFDQCVYTNVKFALNYIGSALISIFFPTINSSISQTNAKTLYSITVRL